MEKLAFTIIGLCASVSVNAIGISGQGTWENTLQGRDLDGNLATFEAYYDTSLNVTWLADMNYAQTSGYDSDGLMNWSTARTWAASLNFNGITGWRLPTTVDSHNDGATYTDVYLGADYGYNVTIPSEMSSMFYDTLGDRAYCTTAGKCPQAGWGLTNTGPFSNVPRYQVGIYGLGYWSATEYVVSGSGRAWNFYFSSGLQSFYGESGGLYAWAVHTGDVGVAVQSAIPIPASAWLFSSGLLGLLGLITRKST